MKQEQQQQAQHLYFQTDLSKAEIAAMLGVSRGTLQNWANDNNWDRIKINRDHIPMQLAENCYHIIAHLQESILSEARAEKPVTPEEVNMMYKLTTTVHKLRSRNTLNESLELNAHFMDFVSEQAPQFIEIVKPLVDAFLVSRAKSQSSAPAAASMAAAKQASHTHSPVAPEKVQPKPLSETGITEALLDLEDFKAWSEDPSTGPRNFTPAKIEEAVGYMVQDGLAEVKAAGPAGSKAFYAAAEQYLKNKLAAYRVQETANPAAGSQKPKPILKNQGMNRAQRRHLARTKTAA